MMDRKICITRSLAAIQSIASHEELKATLVIPLVVLSELEGLAKSCKPEAYKTLDDARKVVLELGQVSGRGV